jgi:hypothetical protein
MLIENIFNFPRIDTEILVFNEVFLAIGDVEVSIIVLSSEIASI